MVLEATDLDDDDKMSKTEFKNLIQVSNSLSVCFANVITAFNEKLWQCQSGVSVSDQFTNHSIFFMGTVTFD